jgi:hypothetical protein
LVITEFCLFVCLKLVGCLIGCFIGCDKLFDRGYSGR